MKLNRYILLTFCGALVVISGFLFSQNNGYRHINRELILQNDSLKSVLINMNREVQK